MFGTLFYNIKGSSYLSKSVFRYVFDAYKITVGLFVQLLFFKLSTVAAAVTTTATIVVVFGIATAAVAMPTAAIYV